MPLSGATKKAAGVFKIMAFRRLPTPGSTTAKCIVLREIGIGGAEYEGCLEDILWLDGMADIDDDRFRVQAQYHPFHTGHIGIAVPKSVVKVMTGAMSSLRLYCRVLSLSPLGR